MAFEFNSTLKSPSANSYISVEEADVFAGGNIKGDSWTSLTTTQKHALLVQSTSRLEAESWSGYPTTSGDSAEQSLQWPRKGVADRNITTNPHVGHIDSDTIPKALKLATFELALHYYSEFIEAPTVSRQDMDRLTSLTIGPLVMAIQARAEEELPDAVKRLLRSVGYDAWQSDRRSFYRLCK